MGFLFLLLVFWNDDSIGHLSSVQITLLTTWSNNQQQPIPGFLLFHNDFCLFHSLLIFSCLYQMNFFSCLLFHYLLHSKSLFIVFIVILYQPLFSRLTALTRQRRPRLFLLMRWTSWRMRNSSRKNRSRWSRMREITL